MTRAASLQRRLGIGLSLGVTALWLAATVASGLVLRHELDEAFDSALQETAQRLLPLAALDIIERETAAPSRRIAALGEHEEFLTYLVRDTSGKVLLQSHDADPAAFPDRPRVGFHETETHRLYGEAAVSGTVLIEVAEPLSHRREAAFEATLALFAPLPLLIPLSLAGVWWLVRRAMSPVLAFNARIEARGAADLSPVASDGLPAEIVPLADAVNGLLDRLHRALEAERGFAANSAHELRTPIAAALAQTQRLIAEAPAGALSDRARRIEESMRRVAALAEKLMQLAKAEGGGLLTETPHDPGAVLTLVVDEFRRAPEMDARLRLALPAQTAFRTHLDPDALAIMLRNLIENALKHGAAGEPVEIAMTDDGAIRVVNGGPVVTPDQLARLKGRFERGATVAGGTGLGLAIAETIAAGAGARLELRSPATDRADGFEAEVRLPG